MIIYAYEKVPFYHKKFNQVGIKPADITTIQSLSKIPITTKQEIQAAKLEDITASDINFRTCKKRSTSGSTGLPLTIFIDRKATDYEDAIWTRTFFENGLSPFDKMVIFSDPRSFTKKKLFNYFGLMRREYISIFENPQKQLSFLKRYKPQIIKGYPSSILSIVDACDYKKCSDFKPRLIFTTAELLDSLTRKFINSTFEVDLLDNYSCNEFGLLSWECHHHMGYHMNADRVFFEFLDSSGKAVNPGESGEIICTDLINRAMPLIRYQTNDVGTPMAERCSCGITLPLLKLINGRKDDFLKTTDGQLVPPTIFFPYPFESFKELKQFRVIQTHSNHLDIQLAVETNFVNDPRIFEKAQCEIKRVFGKDMDVTFQILPSIPIDPNGKLRKIISNIK